MRPTSTIQLSGLGEVLRGKIQGRRDHGILCSQLAAFPPGTIVALDFTGVFHFTGSWVNAAISPLYEWCANDQTSLFPIITGAVKEDDLGELELVGKLNKQCFPVLTDETLLLVGHLDDSGFAALRRITERGESTGASLARDFPEDGVQPTAWNNRLAGLFQQRLLTRRQVGRQQVYSSLTSKVERYG